MAENHIDVAENTENIIPELPPVPVTTPETEPVQINPATENMEVHKHPHHVMHKKKWGEYLLEFFMLFLAVTLGFFAENLREQYAEDKRAQEYAQSLYDDLKVDTAALQRTFNEKQWITSKFDSAQNILTSADIIRNNEFIYYIEKYLTFNDVFTPQDVTYQQLRSSGNFRYIKNFALYKDIGNYYNLYARYQSFDGFFGSLNKNEFSEMESKIFDAKDLASLDNTDVHNFYDVALPSKNKLHPLKLNNESLSLLYVRIANKKTKDKGSTILLGWLNATATRLIKELKDEYHLK